VGAGEATEILLREFQNSRFLTQNIVCLVDDNPYKKGKSMRGITIAGDRNEIPDLVKKYNVQKGTFVFKLFELHSKLFSLGDTFEIYAIKK
jgi:FlaA1/EpsC-like NDP-sugar epimerase